MLGKWQRAFAILFVLIVAACSGGGCSSGCSGCGITPLARPFPQVDEIQNAASARITRSGLDFLAMNAPTLAQTLLGGTGGVIQIAVPNTPETIAGFSANICPNGSNATSVPELCEIDLDIGTSTFHVDAVTPNAIMITGVLQIRSEDIDVDTSIGNIYVGVGNSPTCNGNTPASSSSNPFKPVNYAGIPISVSLPLIAAPVTGFTMIDTTNMAVSVGITSGNVNTCTSCGSICNDILDGLISIAFDLLNSTIQGFIKTAVQNAVAADVPSPIGTSGHVDLSSALQNLSPGTMGGLDFLLAAGGPMIPANLPASATGSAADNVGYTGHTPNGVTLGFLGGALPRPQSACVPPYNNVVPTGIPIPDALESNVPAGWPMATPNPDFGLAIAQRFLNYAFGTIYNSGLLCLGVSTASEQELASGLLSLLIPSIRDLTFQWGKPNPAAAAVLTRPQVPPTVTVGGGTNIKTDPLLSILLKDFAIDFYIFSEDRFVRVFTFTSDLTIPVDLTNTSTGLLPVIGNVTTANAVVTNSELLLDKPTAIASSLSSILGGITGMLTGSLKPIDLSTALAAYGVDVNVSSIGKLTKGSDDFIAIFANLALGSAPMLPPIHVLLDKKTVDPTVMSMATYDRAKLPSLALHVSADESVKGPVEYSYWIDKGTRSEWSTNPEPVVQNDVMFFQGNHVLHVSGRLVGHPESETAVPTDLPFTLDVLPPNIDLELNESATGVTLAAYDFVTATQDLVARYQTVGWDGKAGAWSEWASLASLSAFSPVGSAVTVEVKDLEGNVGSMSIELIRGRPNPAQAASSCNCSTPGARAGNGGMPANMGWALGLGLLLLAAAVRRRSARVRRLTEGRFGAPYWTAGLAAVALGGALSEGCSCGGTAGAQNGQKDGAPPGEGGEVDSGSMCGPTCNQACLPALPPGLVGAYTSTAKSSTGTLWVAGYNDSAVSSAYSGLYGDLVVGKYDPAKSQVAWQSVDGVPALPKGTCAVYDPTGWRKGITDSGDDVGLWTSLQMDANDHPIVSYYDATNQALKFASSSDGTKWNVYAVMQVAGSDIGRYSKMLVIDGIPTIAFLIMEPGTAGKMRSRVEVATASSRTPTSAADWQFEDAAVDDNGPCRAAFCKAPAMCIASTGSCETPATGCKPGCDGGLCVSTDAGMSCETPLASSYIDIYPNAFGDYITLASGPNGLGIAVYDRIDGVLQGVAKAAGSWSAQVIDGWTQPRMPSTGPDGGTGTDDTGDVGVGASLFIATNGDWHISYVNGTTEALQYIVVPGGNKPTSYPEIVDNGLMLDGTPFVDGQHIVGDDSFILVDSSNVVTIRYQDATSGTLRYATGTPQADGTHQWAFHAVAQANKFAGFFPHQLVGDTTVANWWRQTDPATGDISGNVSFVSP
jgi:MYXO-CTERM domain-containing protein